MKQRLSSLDGLRGLAALAVVLSHIDNNLVLLGTGSIVTGIFRTISAGPNAVQILFVLTGFLMAYLYPTIGNSLQFIQKRYTRIFPTFIFLATFFWIITLTSFFANWTLQVVLIIVLAFCARWIWQLVKKVDTTGKLGRIIFLGFCLLQIILIGILIFLLPHVITKFPEGTLPRGILIFLSNITLTMPLSGYTPRLNLVFWSLFAEVLFYICYPFFVIPVVSISKKWGWIVGGIFVLLVTKILFDIDAALMYQGGLLVTNLARGSGFVAGVVVGSLYQQQTKTWISIKKVFQNPLVNIIVLVTFIFMQWGDAYIRNVASQVASNYYFLFSSWIIAFTIIAALIEGSIVQKLFSNKLLVFLGMISYTLYLSHAQAIVWALTLLAPIKQYTPLWLYVLILIVFVTLISIGLAWVLYKIVDSLYFTFRKKLPTEISVNKKVTTKVAKPKFLFFICSLVVYIFLIFAIYAGRYSPSLLIERQRLQIANTPLYSDMSLLIHYAKITFIAKQNNLSTIALAMHYRDNAAITAKKSSHADLLFELFDQNNREIFSSKSTAYMVEGEPEFAFGFPPIQDSKNKKYVVVIKLLNGTSNDQVSINTDPTNLITKYSVQKNLFYPVIFLFNRLKFVVLTPSSLFALLFVPFILIFLVAEKMKNKSK